MPSNKATQWACVAVAAGVAGLMGLAWTGSAVANNARLQAAQKTSVAVIDIGRALESLEERKLHEAELQSFAQQLQDKLRGMQDAVDAAYADLEVLPKSTPQWESQRDEAIRLEMQLQGEQQFADFRFNERKQQAKLRMFRKIVSAAGMYADREGWDIIINDDSKVEIPEDRIGQMNDQAFQAFIATRRVIHSIDAVDITDEIAQWMNNEFKAQ